MPRRRNCFSIISSRCTAYSFFSSMRNRRRMFFPYACFQNLFHLRERRITFLLAIVEVRRNADARLWAIVDKDVPRQEFAANFISMRTLDRNRPCALRRLLRCVHAPAASSSSFHKPRAHAHGFLADCVDADLVDDLQSGLARIERRDMRSTVQVAEGVVARIDGAGLERKRAAMRHPSRKRGTQLGAQIFAHVKVGDARSPAQPLQDSPHCKINSEA